MIEGVRQSAEKVGEWSVMEKFSAPKDPGHGSEDGLYIGKNVAFVSDGVTSQTQEKIDGLTPGQFAVRAAIDALKSPEGQEITSQEIVPFLTKHVLGNLARQRISGNFIPGHPTFVFVAFFPNENKLVRVRDCQYLIDGEGNNPGFAADFRKADLEERIVKIRMRQAEKSGTTLDEEKISKIRQEAKQLSREWQWRQRNNPRNSKYSYGAIDGEDVPQNLIEFIDVPPGSKDIVLTSDGYPPESLSNTLEETHKRYHDMLKEMGLDSDFNIDDMTYVRLHRE